MPLLDHFHPPLAPRRDWHSFHNAWAAAIAGDLNEQLPDDCFAEPNVQYGIEIDVAACGIPAAPAGAGWQPPTADDGFAFGLTEDSVAVEVYRQFGGKILSGAVELVSPANKDRPDTRTAFASKCETLLRAGVGVAIVDVVTERRANLHDELLARVGGDRVAWAVGLYAASYRPTGKSPGGRLDLWARELGLGRPLPSLPLWLPFGLCLEVRLEETYQRTLKLLKIRPPAVTPA